MLIPTRLNSMNVDNIVKKIRAAKNLILSTHRQCDGDGLGAILAIYHALKKVGMNVRVICVDEVPRKYNFLESEKYLEVYEDDKDINIEPTDLVMIFDTNDRRLVEPLYTRLEEVSKEILFVDHHPILNEGPEPTPGSFIDTTAASTGEIAYFIIKSLGIRFDEKIARALYTSLAFDTQIFRYVKNSPNTHLICAELLAFERHSEEIHRSLFANYTRKKITYLGKVLSEVEYLADDRIALLSLTKKDLDDHELDMDDSRDVIDMIMNVNSVEASALIREESPGVYRMSLRSKGHVEVLSIAEHFGDGGHLYAAAAETQGDLKSIHESVKKLLLARVDTN